ncbi:transfer Agent [Aureimonas sp. Leaf454]|uniref:gene transfer agent family protein n=1 Tax=Aureimonas sp. Leaf454 TaxID=1736381 RepID=UPI000701AF5F|nr:gene transfer agent family protein [Aureimonas sp. Leaf454]KQT54914.1 transfer Agent [Aureimonas sp. Leaf454]
MAVNRRRGEVGAIIDGRERVLCLTLGALAELEDAFAAEDVGALMRRFGSGRLGARDLMRILGAGLRGAGESVADVEVGAMRIDGGAAGAAVIAAELLTAAFGELGNAGATQAGAAGSVGAATANP